MKNTIVFFLSGIALVACNGSSTADANANDAPVVDVQADSPVANDVATTDAGTDAGLTDTGVADTGTDVATPTDTGPGDAAVVFNGCTTFTDRSAATADRSVAFGGTVGLAYSPPCVLVHVGQTVTFVGDFVVHPLSKGTPTDPNAGSPANPIAQPAVPSATTMQPVVFTAAGTYPYYCLVHGASANMYGAVQVQ